MQVTRSCKRNQVNRNLFASNCVCVRLSPSRKVFSSSSSSSSSSYFSSSLHLDVLSQVFELQVHINCNICFFLSFSLAYLLLVGRPRRIFLVSLLLTGSLSVTCLLFFLCPCHISDLMQGCPYPAGFFTHSMILLSSHSRRVTAILTFNFLLLFIFSLLSFIFPAFSLLLYATCVIGSNYPRKNLHFTEAINRALLSLAKLLCIYLWLFSSSSSSSSSSFSFHHVSDANLHI